jgi:hypothetical protein
METLNRKVDKQLNKLGLGESYLDESIQYSENREVDFRKTVFRDTAVTEEITDWYQNV